MSRARREWSPEEREAKKLARRAKQEAKITDRCEPVCCECGGMGEHVKGDVIYPHREDLHRRGLRCLYEAIGTYRRCMTEFGPDRPWTRVERLHVTTEGCPDRVFIPHWIGGDEPLANEEELLA